MKFTSTAAAALMVSSVSGATLKAATGDVIEGDYIVREFCAAIITE